MSGPPEALNRVASVMNPLKVGKFFSSFKALPVGAAVLHFHVSVLFSLVGILVIGAGDLAAAPVPVLGGVASAYLQFLVIFTGIAVALMLLGNGLVGRKINGKESFSLVAIGGTPLFFGGIFGIVPYAGLVLVFLSAIYGIYTIYLCSKSFFGGKNAQKVTLAVMLAYYLMLFFISRIVSP